MMGARPLKLEGDPLDVFSHLGWVLRHEGPTRLPFGRVSGPKAMAEPDGAQMRRGPRLVGDPRYVQAPAEVRRVRVETAHRRVPA